MAVAKGMLHNSNQYTGILIIHWGIHTHSEGEMCWSSILLKWHLLHNPIVAWLWYNIIPHLIVLTPLTVPSQKYGPMIYVTGSYTHYHHVWWVLLHLKHVMRILFSPQKLFKIGSWSKPHIHLKRELTHETRLPEIIPTTKHMLCDIVSCQHRWVQLQTLAKITSSPGRSCGQTWSYVVLQVLPIVSAWTGVVIVQWKRQPRHRSQFGILVNCSKENPSYSST